MHRLFQSGVSVHIDLGEGGTVVSVKAAPASVVGQACLLKPWAVPPPLFLPHSCSVIPTATYQVSGRGPPRGILLTSLGVGVCMCVTILPFLEGVGNHRISQTV